MNPNNSVSEVTGTNPMSLKERFAMARQDILCFTEDIFLLKDTATKAVLPEGADFGEIVANITLAYRHLEDARMRLGKAIQAYDGGKSIYP